MKISKHSHSCLLIQDRLESILIDPGVYTEQDNSLNIDQLTELNTILVTHSHADHLSLTLIKKILKKFPHAVIITNNEVKSILEKEGVRAQTHSNNNVTISNAMHEKLPIATPPPENTLLYAF